MLPHVPKSLLVSVTTHATANIELIAGYTMVSRQALENITFLQTWLPQSLVDEK